MARQHDLRRDSTPSPPPTEPVDVVYSPGEFIYLEVSQSQPYDIGQIDSIAENPTTGQLEVTVAYFIRRQDTPKAIVMKAERDHGISSDTLSRAELFECYLHELYPTDTTKVYPIGQIRGKCIVVRMSQVETPNCYRGKNDVFFYRLFCRLPTPFQPHQLSPLEQSSVRVGVNYQAIVPRTIIDPQTDTRDSKDLEDQVFSPDYSLSELEIEQFITISQSLGTYGRAYLQHEGKLPSNPNASLLSIAAASSRDYTTESALTVLYKSNFDFNKAILHFVPNNRPIVCVDETDKWSVREMKLFEEGFEKYGKKFHKIRQFLSEHPALVGSNFDKTVSNLVEYYYAWKKSNRKAEHQRLRETSDKKAIKSFVLPEYSRPYSDMRNEKCFSCKQFRLCHPNCCGPVTYGLCAWCHEYWMRMGHFVTN